MKEKVRVVITGMGVVSPCGNVVPEFWNAITNGKSGIRYLKKFDASNFKCKLGGEVWDFNPTNYGMTTKEARRKDLFAQYAIAASDMAIKDAGLVFADHNEDISVLLGVGLGGLQTLEDAKVALMKGDIVSPHTIPMLMPNAAAAEISIRYKIHGPSASINAACASGLYAIIQSVINIQAGLTKVVITGGSEAAISPLAYTAFANMQPLTKSGYDYSLDPSKASKPFDKKRDGFVMSDGSAVLVIESLEHAVQRGARIHAEIIGFRQASDA